MWYALETIKFVSVIIALMIVLYGLIKVLSVFKPCRKFFNKLKKSINSLFED